MPLHLRYHILLLVFLKNANSTEWDHYDDQDLALSIPTDAIGASAQFRKKVIGEMVEMNRVHDTPENRCFCNYGEEICGKNSTCVKHQLAACYHSVELKYNKIEKRMETRHQFGCASLERGSGASHLTCNQWRSSHHSPRSIACCYQGNYCNRDIKPPKYANVFKPYEVKEEELALPSNPGLLIFFSIAGILLTVLICLIVSFVVYRKKTKMSASSIATNSTFLEKETMLPFYEDSGSGSGQATLIQRTVRQDLTIIKNIGQGRYGEVRQASYRGSYVAVKTFYTTDEESWKNERDVYQTHMINHENILQFVAADIWSEDSMTKMLLVTDYHELGSLSDYLRREDTLTTVEAIRLIHSCICGIDHLHNAVRGTGSIRKPEIAHRDIKSKNIIVKRAGVCCIADLGLALRFDDGIIIPNKFNVQVGTKRYMAPELLSNTLNPSDFSQFKMADIYSMALVMWEVARRVEDRETNQPSDFIDDTASHSESSGVGDSLSSDGRRSAVRVRPHTTSADLSLKAKPYTPPFDDIVDSDPSFEQMRDVVCEKAVRPQLEDAWVKGNNMVLCKLSRLMAESWHANPQCRHTSLKLKMEMNKLIENMQGQSSPKKSPTTDAADSGIIQSNSSKLVRFAPV